MAIVNHNYSLRSEPEGGFKSVDSFYPYYLGEVRCIIIITKKKIVAGQLQYEGR